MSHPNHQRRRNRTFRVEPLESRALLSTAGVVSLPAAAIAPLARSAHFPSIAADPSYAGRMMGVGSSDLAAMRVNFNTTGSVTGIANIVNQRDAFFGGASQFNGDARVQKTHPIFGRPTIEYTGGTATLISPTGQNKLYVSFKGTETNIMAGLTGFKLEGRVTKGAGVYNMLKERANGSFSADGTFNSATFGVSLGFSIEF